MFQLAVLASEGENPPILPHDTNEIIWGTIAFLIVLGLIIWKGGPAIRDMWNGRIERLQNDLDQAASARQEGEALLADVDHRIANEAQERARIRNEAAATAQSLETQIAEKADRDAADLKRRALHDLEASQAQAVADLQAEIASLALGAAEEVVARNLDEATQRQLIDSYIDDVGSGRAGTEPAEGAVR